MSEYTEDFEQLLKRYGEHCECYAILHHYAHLKYSKLSNYTNIPVIVITSLLGILIQLNLGFEQQNIFLGLFSMLGSVVKTLDSYFDFTKKSQSHLNISTQYASISAYLQIQLSLEKERRVNSKDLLDIITNQIDSIRKSEPTIDDDVINQFNYKYKDDKTYKPSIVNGLTNIKITGSKTPLSSVNNSVLHTPLLEQIIKQDPDKLIIKQDPEKLIIKKEVIIPNIKIPEINTPELDENKEGNIKTVVS